MKGSFTADELTIWRGIYGPSQGPTPARLKILVEDWERAGLAPVMMRVDDALQPYDREVFHTALQECFTDKDDDRVQVYYHPGECERVVGSSQSNWTRWARLVLDKENLAPMDAPDDNPVVAENLPRVQLPLKVK